MKGVFILLGSNRGDRTEYLEKAVQMITACAGTVLQKSSVYETEPWGFEDSTTFLNQVVEIETTQDPEELLEHLLAIETKLGRIRPFSGCGCSTVPWSDLHGKAPANQQPEANYASRTIDLDILLYNEQMVFTDNLMIPHPRMHERRFSLVPLNEIAPGFIHPLLKKTISHLLIDCRDKAKVIPFYR